MHQLWYHQAHQRTVAPWSKHLQHAVAAAAGQLWLALWAQANHLKRLQYKRTHT